MSEIKLTIDGTDYKLSRMAGISDPSPTPFMVFEGKSYMGEAIPKEKGIPKEFDYDVLCWECKDGKDGYKRPSTVKRLTDNFVFNVGDETDKGKITMFTIQKDNLYVHIDHLWYYINHIQKVKPKVPLLTTEEGIEVYEPNTPIYTVQQGDAKTTFITWSTNAKSCTQDPKIKYFHSEANREQFVKDNINKKPLFTTEDGCEIFDKDEVYSVRKCDWLNNGYKFHAHAGSISLERDRPKNAWWYFSTQEAADQFVLLNKPVKISLKELEDIVNIFYIDEGLKNNINQAFKNFYVHKSKINP